MEVREEVWQRQVEWWGKQPDGEDVGSLRVLGPRVGTPLLLSPEAGVWDLRPRRRNVLLVFAKYVWFSLPGGPG